jgi:hypothetical protein
LGHAVIACDKREAFAQGSDSDEAIHLSASGGMDCFAALAMTSKPGRRDYRVFQNATTRWAVAGIRRA